MTLTVARLRWLASAPRASVVRWAAGLTDAQKRSVLAQVDLLERQSAAGLRGGDGMGSWLSRAIRSVRDVIGGVVGAIPIVGPLLAPILGSGSNQPQPREGDIAQGQDGRQYRYTNGQWVPHNTGKDWMPIVLIGGVAVLAVAMMMRK